MKTNQLKVIPPVTGRRWRPAFELVPSLLLLFIVCLGSYRAPVADFFDRLIYEAIVLGKSKPIEEVYGIVKHENARAEASGVLNSPEHLRELEPLYAIRPLYIQILWWLSFVIPLRSAIDLVSAAAYFGIGIVAMAWTRRPFLSALLMAAYPLTVLARIGSPDALSALLVISALWLIEQEIAPAAAFICLFLSLAVRTDNLVLTFVVLGWLAWKKRLSYIPAAALALLSTAIVYLINRWAGNYGWVALMHYSFVGDQASAAHVPHTLTLAQYVAAVFRGAVAIAVHVVLWILLGVVTWMRYPNTVLLILGLAVAGHFFLFPSPEDRYFVWAYIVTGIMLIRSLSPNATLSYSTRR